MEVDISKWNYKMRRVSLVRGEVIDCLHRAVMSRTGIFGLPDLNEYPLWNVFNAMDAVTNPIQDEVGGESL